MPHILSFAFSLLVFAASPMSFAQAQRCDVQLPRQSLCLQFDWQTMPVPRRTEGTATVRIYSIDSNGNIQSAANTNYTLVVEPFMPAHGHGSRLAVVANPEVGVYSISRVSFTMPGTWEVRFKFLDQARQVFEQGVLSWSI